MADLNNETVQIGPKFRFVSSANSFVTMVTPLHLIYVILLHFNNSYIVQVHQLNLHKVITLNYNYIIQIH